MLTARTVEELFESQRAWVDPVNNFVAADRAGSIGYLTRGRLPVRASKAGRRLPTPGWTEEHAWLDDVPFEAMPRSVNPPEGFIATANQAVLPTGGGALHSARVRRAVASGADRGGAAVAGAIHPG